MDISALDWWSTGYIHSSLQDSTRYLPEWFFDLIQTDVSYANHFLNFFVKKSLLYAFSYQVIHLMSTTKQ